MRGVLCVRDEREMTVGVVVCGADRVFRDVDAVVVVVVVVVAVVVVAAVVGVVGENAVDASGDISGEGWGDDRASRGVEGRLRMAKVLPGRGTTDAATCANQGVHPWVA